MSEHTTSRSIATGPGPAPQLVCLEQQQTHRAFCGKMMLPEAALNEPRLAGGLLRRQTRPLPFRPADYRQERAESVTLLHWHTESGRAAQTHQTAIGKEATQIAVCDLMGTELPQCQTCSPLVQGRRGTDEALLIPWYSTYSGKLYAFTDPMRCGSGVRTCALPLGRRQHRGVAGGGRRARPLAAGRHAGARTGGARVRGALFCELAHELDQSYQ